MNTYSEATLSTRTASQDITSTFSNESQHGTLLKGVTVVCNETNPLYNEILQDATIHYGGTFIKATSGDAFISQAVARAADENTLYITNNAQYASALRFLLLRNKLPTKHRVCVQTEDSNTLPHSRDFQKDLYGETYKKITVRRPGDNPRELFERFSAARSYEQSGYTSRYA